MFSQLPTTGCFFFSVCPLRQRPRWALASHVCLDRRTPKWDRRLRLTVYRKSPSANAGLHLPSSPTADLPSRCHHWKGNALRRFSSNFVQVAMGWGCCGFAAPHLGKARLEVAPATSLFSFSLSPFEESQHLGDIHGTRGCGLVSF